MDPRSLTAKLDAVIDAHRDPKERLARLRAAQTWLVEAQVAAMRDAIDAGMSWSQVGVVCGVSKQTAWDRWRRRRIDFSPD